MDAHCPLINRFDDEGNSKSKGKNGLSFPGQTRSYLTRRPRVIFDFSSLLFEF
jgi:hypothetical protein